MIAAFGVSFYVYHPRLEPGQAGQVAAVPTGRSAAPMPRPSGPESAPGTAGQVAVTSVPSGAAVNPADTPLSAPIPEAAIAMAPMVAEAAASPSQAKTEVPKIGVRQIQLSSIQSVERGNLWVADTVSNPAAILVLFVDPNDKADSFVRNRDWQQFALQNNLALSAVSLQPKETNVKGKKTVAILNPKDGFGKAIVSALDSAWHKPLPLIVYGRYGAGAFAAGFARVNSSRATLWAAYGNEWKDAPSVSDSSGPGMIVCDREGVQHSTEAQDFFHQGRALGKPWTWLCLNTPWKDRAGRLDQFFRNYAGTYLQGGGNIKAGVWAHTDTFLPMSTLDVMTKAKDAAWLPNPALVADWAALMPSSAVSGPVTILQRSVPTRNPKQPTLQLYLRLPRSADKQPITGILAFCTWEQDQAAILSKLDIQADDKPVDLPGPAALVRSIVRYAEDHRMAVLTWGTAEVWDNHMNTEELEHEKQRQFDRNFDLLANAWERGVKELSKEAGGVPTNNMLLYGMSRGAQWAHRLALRKPDYFLAVHVHIPSTFDKPTPEANKPLWLLTTGELEYGFEGAKAFYQECRALDYPIIFKAIEGLGHQGSAIADSLGLRFFDYALSVKAQREKYQVDSKDTLFRFMKRERGPWLQSFRQPEYFGDFVNQDYYPLAQAEMVPKNFRVPLPNKILADAWNK